MRIPAGVAIALWLVVSPLALGKSKAIHVFVALCDNQHQGIVPVPKQLGNGDDPANNLYWGALYGTKAFLKRSKDWTVVATQKRPSEQVLERVIFRHSAGQAYLVADAYRGCEIKKAVGDFLDAAGEPAGADAERALPSGRHIDLVVDLSPPASAVGLLIRIEKAGTGHFVLEDWTEKGGRR